jgi:hypothetical protein
VPPGCNGPGNDRLNMIAPANPVGAVVTQANASNVQWVFVAGKVVKRDGRLLDVDFSRTRQIVEESCAHAKTLGGRRRDRPYLQKALGGVGDGVLDRSEGPAEFRLCLFG